MAYNFELNGNYSTSGQHRLRVSTNSAGISSRPSWLRVVLTSSALMCGLAACDRVEEPPDTAVAETTESVDEALATADSIRANTTYDVGIIYELRAGTFGLSELMIAAKDGDLDAVSLLIASGADVNATDNGNSTVLMWSVYSGSADIAKVLIANGADINAKDKGKNSVLLRSANSGNFELVQLLLELGTEVNAVDIDGNSALSGAVYNDHEAIALVLLEYGAEPNVFPERTRSNLLNAVSLDQTSVVDALIQHGVDLETQGQSALVEAARKGNQAIVQILIDAGINANEATKNGGSSALYLAARNGDVDMVDTLLANGASVVNSRNHSAPLHVAAKSGHLAVVESLLSGGAPVNFSNVYVALENRQVEITQILLDEIDIDSIDRKSIDRLLILADRTDQTGFVQQFFAAAGGPRISDASVRLLYKSITGDDCNVRLWNLRTEKEKVVFSSPGECKADFFVADNESTLFVLEDDEFQVIPLDDESSSYRVRLPSQEMDEQLQTVIEQLKSVPDSYVPDWMAVTAAGIGFLDDGKLGLLVHIGLPIDGTKSLLYSRSGDDWNLIGEGGCNRMENYCSFPQLNGRKLRDWPLQRAIWHPNIKKNPYFTSRSAEFDQVYGTELQGGEVRFNINGHPVTVVYKTREGGHCIDDCTFTSHLESHVEDSDPIVLSSYWANNAIAGYYALIPGDDRQSVELLDIRSGQSVLGVLNEATWVE